MRRKSSRLQSELHQSPTKGSRALELFVDRFTYCDNYVRRLNDDTSQPPILYFHGEGGNGKSLLLDFLRLRLTKLIDSDNWKYLDALAISDRIGQIAHAEVVDRIAVGFLDISGPHQDPLGQLLHLRREFARSGLKLPMFDYAVVLYYHKTNQLTDEKLKSTFPASDVSATLEIAAVVSRASGIELVAKLFAYFDTSLGMWFRRYQLRRNLAPEDVTIITAMDPDTELFETLPELFALDLVAAVSDPADAVKAVLFIDSYEALWGVDRDRAGESHFLREEWLRRLLIHFGADDNVEVVIAGRELPTWHKAPVFANIDFEALHVGDLPNEDADEYLRRVGVKDSDLRRRLCKESMGIGNGIHPFYLGLNADFAMSAMRLRSELSIEDLDHDIQRFSSREQQVVDRFLRYADAETRSALISLAACRLFTYEVYRYLGRVFDFITSRSRFSALTEFSFIRTTDQGEFQMHDLLRRLLTAHEDSLVRSSHLAMESYYVALVENDAESGAALEAIYHANQAEWARGFGIFTTVCEHALRSSRIRFCSSLVQLLPDLRIESNTARATAAALTCDFYFRIGRLEDSFEEGQKALRFFEEVAEEHDEFGARRNDTGNVLLRLAEIDALRGRTEESFQWLAQASHAFDEALQIEPSNVGVLSNKAHAHTSMAKALANDGKLAKAEQDFAISESALKRALDIDPLDSISVMSLGLIYLVWAESLVAAGIKDQAESKYSRAIGCFSRAVRLAPNEPVIWHNRGLAWTSRGNMFAKQDRRRHARLSYALGIRSIHCALKLAPENVSALSNRSIACEELGWLLLVWEDPKDLHYVQGLFEAALEAIQTAALLAPANSEYQVVAARLEKRMERFST